MCVITLKEGEKEGRKVLLTIIVDWKGIVLACYCSKQRRRLFTWWWIWKEKEKEKAQFEAQESFGAVRCPIGASRINRVLTETGVVNVSCDIVRAA
jgi:hypothetical protein